MKLSDYVFEFLHNKGIETVFYLAGGGCMHLLDSLGKSSAIKHVALLHEQAVAIACESYANTKGSPGTALVTTGPGSTNTVTGVLAAYLDSSPCFFISGQVKTADLKSRYGVRSLGSQEADIVSIVKPITKYAEMVTDPNTILYHLEKAWHEMTTGRKGPVWLDIPLDIQGAQIEPDNLTGYTPNHKESKVNVQIIIDALNNAKRPVIIAGNGLSACKDNFYKLIDFLQVPVIPTWKAMDYLTNSHSLYSGRAGGMGDRHGNLTMQNADLLLCLGSRLDFSLTGNDRSEWAVNAKKIVVDIDEPEIKKLEGSSHIIPLISDVSDVIESLLEHKSKIQVSVSDLEKWKEKINEWKKNYPVITKEKYNVNSGYFTTYAFVDTLCKNLNEGTFIAPCSAGTTAEIFFQCFTVKQGQTIRSSHGLGSMGFEIPNAIGMCIANGKKPVICIAGDGGVQLNIQELAVVKGLDLPIKIFVINNNGYASIRNMQNNLFEKRHVGCDTESGLFLPKLRNVAEAYDIEYRFAYKLEDLDIVIKDVLNLTESVLCEIIVDPECLVSPRTSTMVMPDGSLKSTTLENQFPFLPEEEAAGNMLI